MEENKQKIIFGLFVKGEFKGWRQDTFGTLGADWAKIYTYSPSQVETVKKGTLSNLSKSGTSFMKKLLSFGTPMDTEGKLLDKDEIITQIEKAEDEKRSWGDFELRVYEAPFDYDGYEKWKMEAFNNALPTPLEVHKFTTVKDEN